MNTWKKMLTLGVISAILAACSHSPLPESTLTVQDFGTSLSDVATSVAAPRGGVGATVAGFTYGSLHAPNLGDADAFIRRYDDGVGWESQFGSRSFDTASDITMTSTGISYVIGETLGSLRFKVGGRDVFLRKYAANGALQWTRQFGTSGNDFAQDVSLDSSGNVYVLSKDNGTSFRIRKFNPGGTLLQTITSTTANITAAPALAVDSTGNIFVLTRFFENPISWGRIYKYDSAGTLLADSIVSGERTTPYDLLIDSSNNVTFSLFNDENNSDGGGFVIKMNNALTQYLWTKSIEPATTGRVSFPYALALDSKNHVYVTGYTNGAYSNFTNRGSGDIFVLKLASATGNRLWTRQFGGNDYDTANGIAVSDAVYVAGFSNSNPNLLGDPSYCNCSGISPDPFLAQLNLGNGAILGIDQ